MAKNDMVLKKVQEALECEPGECLEDGMILEFVCKALMEEPLLKNCSIRLGSNGKLETVRESLYKLHGDITVSVCDGEVSLGNYVLNLTQKRLAEVLAWWMPGIRSVINRLEVAPPKENADNEISDAIRMVLEKDPFLNADQIQITSLNSTVTLKGSVLTETQRQMAENDAWHTIGVEKVVNDLTVQK